MTRVEFFFNVPDKLAKVVDLCEKATAKGRQLTIFTPDEVASTTLHHQLWLKSATSFLASATPGETGSAFAPIILDSIGKQIIQDDILINLQTEHPPFFSRFRYLVEIVGLDEEDKLMARSRYKFYRDRGYQIKSTDITAV